MQFDIVVKDGKYRAVKPRGIFKKIFTKEVGLTDWLDSHEDVLAAMQEPKAEVIVKVDLAPEADADAIAKKVSGAIGAPRTTIKAPSTPPPKAAVAPKPVKVKGSPLKGILERDTTIAGLKKRGTTNKK